MNLAIQTKLPKALLRIANDATLSAAQKRQYLAEFLDGEFITLPGDSAVQALVFSAPWGATRDFWRALDSATKAASLESLPDSLPGHAFAYRCL